MLGAGLLLGSASAAVHKMKLQKIPLSEQLTHADIDAHVAALGQKYMGGRPDSHADELFKSQPVGVNADGHPVPVSNFLNAQCKAPALPLDPCAMLTSRRRVGNCSASRSGHSISTARSASASSKPSSQTSSGR